MSFDPGPRTILPEIEVNENHAGLRIVDLTSVSLIDRLKVARPEAIDWERLQGLYLPLVQRWLRCVPGLGNEADDVAQEVFVVVVRQLPRFERRREAVPRLAADDHRQVGPELLQTTRPAADRRDRSSRGVP